VCDRYITIPADLTTRYVIRTPANGTIQGSLKGFVGVLASVEQDGSWRVMVEGGPVTDFTNVAVFRREKNG
jgi:hypothetical protein